MSEALLSVTKASVAYGNVEAVRSVSLDVRQNEIVTIIGANGAGKTTLLNAIIGLLRLKGGLTFDTRDLTRFEIEDRVAAGLCLVPEHRELFGTMPVEDNLLLGGFRIKAAQAAETLEKVFALFPRLKERRRQLAGTLSGGEQQMLAMGRALMGHPRLLMLDEPSLGLAPTIVESLYGTLERLHAEGLTLLLAEQSIELALEVADHGYVLQTGRTVLNGSAAELRNDPHVQEVYFGVSKLAAD
jgi:branched-chain amino acid transport system ATP-binding protein